MLADEIQALEVRLLDPAVRKSGTDLERLLADDFTEFGSSGRVYDKAEVIAALGSAPTLGPPDRTISDFRVRELGPGVVLATYRCAASLRSSIWRSEQVGWRLLFHQGTPVPGQQ